MHPLQAGHMPVPEFLYPGNNQSALSIGVSNFEIRHLEELEANSGIIPAVNQIECHPLCYPKEPARISGFPPVLSRC